MRKIYDAIVVGSGFGGAVAACRLAERGCSVLVLERGRRWGRTDFPRPGQSNAPWRFGQKQSGLFEVRRFPGMSVIVAAGVGGGSLVYTNVQKIPPASAFARWPAPITLDYLRPYYERVREMLEPSPIPVELQRLNAFRAAHARVGREAGVERPPLAVCWPESGTGGDDRERVNRFGASQQPCNFCGVCVFGCDRHSKNTLDLNYLKRAENLGAEIRPLCQVTRIVPRGDSYEVFFRRLTDAPESGLEEVLRTRAVFLAAGSLGTSEVLLRARDADRTLPQLSPRLGESWSANGDFFAGLLDSRLPVQPSIGPSAAGGYDAADTEGFYALEGSIPPVLARRHQTFLRFVVRAASLLRFSWRRRSADSAGDREACGDPEAEELLRHLGAFFLIGRDGSDGRLRLNGRGALDLDWDPRSSELLFGRMRRYLAELGRGYGGWMLIPQGWWKKDFGTVHPLGGCGMGRDASEGVCDPYGRVFGYQNLYVCDGSLFPRALGVPPSMTIAALAELVLEKSLAG